MLSDRMTTDIAATALESAMSHRYVAGNAIFHSDRSSQYATGRSLSGRAPNDRVPVVQPYRQLPRQHHGRVALRHVEERDALQGKLSYQGRQSCRHRAHQGRLQPEKAPRPSVTRCPRMPCSRSSSTRSLNRSRFPLPSSSSSSMSENLTQITLAFLALPLCRLLKIAPLL